MGLKEISKIISDYFQNEPIIRAWIFGSFARGDDNPLSDVDLLVEYEKEGVSLLKHTSIICDLEKLLDRSVDLVQVGTLRPELLENINQDKKLIYERSFRDNKDRLNHIKEVIDTFVVSESAERKIMLQTATRMKFDGLTIHQISRYTGLSAEEIEEL